MTTARFVVTAARRTPTPQPVAPSTLDIGVDVTPLPSATGSAAGARAVPVLRIAVWQVAVVLGFVAVGRGWVVGVIAGGAALGLLLVSAVRVGGVWLSSLAGTWVGFVTRRRVHAGQHLPLPRGTAITSEGVLAGAEGLTVVARTQKWIFPQVEADADGPELDLQLVVHRGPRQARPGGWLAISVRRDADLGEDDTLRVTLGNVLRRLRKSGHDLGALSAVELRPMLAGMAHAGPSREHWRSWRSGPVTQVTLRVAGATTTTLDRLLAEGRDAAVTIAIRSTGDGVLRIAATSPAAAGLAVARIQRLGAHLGVRLHRLDGRHQPALLASRPIGGTQ
ncbi:hypothetical protein AB0M20_24610 [Actinoplanes sp. NPDC051633]|uniref:hypothetical protein n=1 Tax=Actinoplanes sp. NPDC051633 TaxID=3155670 RepID=UPI003422792B